MSTVRSRRLSALLVASAIVLVSCGGSDSSSTSTGARQRNAALTTDVRRVRTKIRHFVRNDFVNMAISNEDELVVWGNERFRGMPSDNDMPSVFNPPVAKVRLAAVARRQGVAIDLNNEFHAWGDDTDQLSAVPAGVDLSQVKSLILDENVVMVISEDGKLSAWGPIWTDNPEASIPTDVLNARIVEADTYNAQLNVALDDTGKVHVWGNNSRVASIQQAFDGVSAKHVDVDGTTVTVVSNDGKVLQAGSSAKSNLFEGIEVEHIIRDGWGNHLAIDTDNIAHFVSGNASFDTAFDEQITQYNSVAAEDLAPKVVSMSSGNAYFTVLLDDGNIYDFVGSWDSWTELPEYFYSSQSVSPIAAGNYRSFAVRDDYSITNFHTLMEGDVAPPTDNEFLAVAAGWSHGLGLRRNGTVVSWGDGPNGNDIPEGLDPVRQIGAGYGFSAVRDIFGQISSWGSFQSSTSSKEKPDGDFWYREMSTGYHNIIAVGWDDVNSTDVLHVWGDNSYGQADVPSDLDANEIRDVAIGYDCAAAVMYDGSVRIWGQCETKQKDIPAGEEFFSVKMSMGLIAGITYAGDVLAWGTYAADLPEKPANMRNIREIAVGSGHILALDYDGGVTAWGPNVWGENNVPDDLKPLPMDDIYDENYDDNLSDEKDNVDSQVEASKNPVPVPTVVDDTPIAVVKNGEVVSVQPTVPNIPEVTSVLDKEPIIMTALPAARNPVTSSGKVVTVAQAVKLLGLKKVTKAAFVVPSKASGANAKVCSITKTAVTITGTGICDVKVSYVDSKKRKQTKALPLVSTP